LFDYLEKKILKLRKPLSILLANQICAELYLKSERKKYECNNNVDELRMARDINSTAFEKQTDFIAK
jgi:hypothetical protein